jgi:transposase
MVTVGIDPHKKTHTATVLDESGRRLGGELTVKDEPDAVARLIAWSVKHAAGRGVEFAIEDGRGLGRRLATGLVVAGYGVVWVPVRLMVAERSHCTKRGKSDPIDSWAVARAAQNPDNADYLSPHRVDEIGRVLAYLVDERRDRVAERTRLTNSLRWRLHELGAGLAPGTLKTLKAPSELAETLAARPDEGTAHVLRELLIRTCEDLVRLTERINELDRDITTRVQALVPTLLARHGVGPIVAATIVGELGDPARVRGSAAFARLNGTAPIPVWTSDNPRHRLDRGGNRRLNNAIHTVARAQARSHPPAQALITKHQEEKGAKGALRVLKRHLSDILWRDLMTDINHLTSQHAPG